MHPPLHRPHPQCEEYVNLLIACHEEHNIGKWFGACNDFKRDIDHCFKMEKEAKRKANMDKARDFDRRFEDYLVKKEQQSAGK